jgi:hypothetical protein
MKKLIVISTFLLLLTSSCGSCSSDKVYICDSKGAYAYHINKDCMGLRRCMAEIRTISKEEAIKMRRKPCGICYR